MKVQTRINKLAKVKFLVKFQMSSIVSTTSEVASFADFVNFEKALCPKELEANRRLSKPLVFVTATECLEKWKKCFSRATQMSILEGKKDVFAPLLCGDLRRMVAKLLSKKVDRVTEPEDPLDDDESTHWEIDLTSHSSDVVRRVTVTPGGLDVLNSRHECTLTVGTTIKRASDAVTRIRLIPRTNGSLPFDIPLKYMKSKTYDNSIRISNLPNGHAAIDKNITKVWCGTCQKLVPFDGVNPGKLRNVGKTVAQQNQLARHNRNNFNEVLRIIRSYGTEFQARLSAVPVTTGAGAATTTTTLFERWCLRYGATNAKHLFKILEDKAQSTVNENSATVMYVLLSELPVSVVATAAVATASTAGARFVSKLCKCQDCRNCLWDVADAFLGHFYGNIWASMLNMISLNLKFLATVKYITSKCCLDESDNRRWQGLTQNGRQFSFDHARSDVQHKRDRYKIWNSVHAIGVLTRQVTCKSYGTFESRPGRVVWRNHSRGFYFLCCHALAAECYARVRERCVAPSSSIADVVASARTTLRKIWHPSDPITSDEQEEWVNHYVGFDQYLPTLVRLLDMTETDPLFCVSIPSGGQNVSLKAFVAPPSKHRGGGGFALNVALRRLLVQVSCTVAVDYQIEFVVPMQFLRVGEIGLATLVERDYGQAWQAIFAQVQRPWQHFVSLLNNHLNSSGGAAFGAVSCVLMHGKSNLLQRQVVEELCVEGLVHSLTAILWFYVGDRVREHCTDLHSDEQRVEALRCIVYEFVLEESGGGDRDTCDCETTCDRWERDTPCESCLIRALRRIVKVLPTLSEFVTVLERKIRTPNVAMHTIPQFARCEVVPKSGKKQKKRKLTSASSSNRHMVTGSEKRSKV